MGNQHSDCSECEGQKHHWMESVTEEGVPVVECKHCDAEVEMTDETTFIETSQGSHSFYFVCEGCGSEGMLDIPQNRMLKQFGCPEECGAVYIPWTDPTGKPALQCVVCPVFEEA